MEENEDTAQVAKRVEVSRLYSVYVVEGICNKDIYNNNI